MKQVSHIGLVLDDEQAIMEIRDDTPLNDRMKLLDRTPVRQKKEVRATNKTLVLSKVAEG